MSRYRSEICCLMDDPAAAAVAVAAAGADDAAADPLEALPVAEGAGPFSLGLGLELGLGFVWIRSNG